MPSRLESLFIENPPSALSDRVTELTMAASRLGHRLHPETQDSLANLVRAVNCYYSNRIEGHNTSLREIERAMSEDFDVDDKRRNLQIEARAHIRLQRHIDRMYLYGYADAGGRLKAGAWGDTTARGNRGISPRARCFVSSRSFQVTGLSDRAARMALKELIDAGLVLIDCFLTSCSDGF